MKKNNKGFTLAELLIVVAIIAVLVAVAIPVFTSQLEKSREATDLANVRAAYAEVITQYLADDTAKSVDVEVKQQRSGWQCNGDKSKAYVGTDIGSAGQVAVPAKTKDDGSYKVKITDSGVVSVE